MPSPPHSGTASAPRKIPLRFVAVALALALLIVLVLILLLTGGTGDQRTIDRRTGPDKGAPATITSSTGVLRAGGVRLLPIPQGALRDAVGKSVSGRAVAVQAALPRHGFWVGNSDAQRIYVAYDGTAPATGRRVTLQGSVRRAPQDPGKALTLRGDDAQQVQAEGGYIEATTVKVVGKPIGTVPKGP
jgi:hypothetical protein